MNYTLVFKDDRVLAPQDFKSMSLPEILECIPLVRFGEEGMCTHKLITPRLFLVDGTSLSVQASENTYCDPRNNYGPYTKVEVGYPSSEPPETWREYAEEWDKPTYTIYAYIPMAHVLFYIGAHGGIDYDRTFDGFKLEPR